MSRSAQGLCGCLSKRNSARPSPRSRYPIGGSAAARRKRIVPYYEPAGGWGALKALGEHLVEQRVVVKGGTTLLRMNQPQGFDCPGCAWPDPKHTSSFEFCEYGG